MTRREKIRILKAMLPLIDSIGFIGMCRAIRKTIRRGVFLTLDDLGLKRPRQKVYSVWWYRRDEKGDNQRRAAIRRAIKKLQAK